MERAPDCCSCKNSVVLSEAGVLPQSKAMPASPSSPRSRMRGLDRWQTSRCVSNTCVHNSRVWYEAKNTLCSVKATAWLIFASIWNWNLVRSEFSISRRSLESSDLNCISLWGTSPRNPCHSFVAVNMHAFSQCIVQTVIHAHAPMSHHFNSEVSIPCSPGQILFKQKKSAQATSIEHLDRQTRNYGRERW